MYVIFSAHLWKILEGIDWFATHKRVLASSYSPSGKVEAFGGCNFSFGTSNGTIQVLKFISSSLLLLSLKKGKNIEAIAASRIFSVARLTRTISSFGLLFVTITLLLDLFFNPFKFINPPKYVKPIGVAFYLQKGWNCGQKRCFGVARPLPFLFWLAMAVCCRNFASRASLIALWIFQSISSM